MGRYDTVAWQRILALCTIYGVDKNGLKKKSKKILSLYSDLVVLKKEQDEFDYLYPSHPMDYLKALSSMLIRRRCSEINSYQIVTKIVKIDHF